MSYNQQHFLDDASFDSEVHGEMELIQYWKHNACGNKLQFSDGGVYCPACRRGLTALDAMTLVEFSNPVVRVIPNREEFPSVAPSPAIARGHSSHRGFQRREVQYP